MDTEIKLFISHASEDKDDFVRPLAEALVKTGFAVWYDEYSLKMGDRLKQQIDKGLQVCDYAVVVLSKAFFEKHWPQEELDGICAIEASRKSKVLLPIWHGITFNDIAQYSPTLAGKIAVISSKGIESVVSEIVNTVNSIETDTFLRQQDNDTATVHLYTRPSSLCTHYHETFHLVKDSLSSWEDMGKELLKECKKLDRKKKYEEE